MKDNLAIIYTKFVSVIQIVSSSQFGEITAKCALQLKDVSKHHHNGATASPNNCADITKTLQTIPGLGPKQAKKLLAHFGSLFNVVNASLVDLEGVVSQTLAMSVYQFLH